MAKKNSLERWTIHKSADLYSIENWGAGYFSISEQGEVVVTPEGTGHGPTISLMDVVSGLKERGMGMPALLRLEDILASRIKTLHETFAKAIKELGYKGVYRGVYPIKVNQQEQVIGEITRCGERYHHGLEAGSKAELLAAISFVRDPEAFVICNGYKDEEFVDLALYALKMGINAVLVLESPGELPLILKRAAALDVRPRLGVRIKLSAKVGGHWMDSGGDRSVFGLNTLQVINVVDQLRKSGHLDCLQLLHYHLGSQIPNIRDIRSAVIEAGRIYEGLVKEGAPMGVLDLGGGLAVDYDGSHTNFPSSRNYSLDEYCADIIETVKITLDDADIAHPTIVTESGRAIVAYYSVLLFNILDVSRFEAYPATEEMPADSHEFLLNMAELPLTLTTKNAQECFHDALYYRDEIRQLFKHGAISLRERAVSEKLFWNVITKTADIINKQKYIPDELEGLNAVLSDIYYGNFSVFQSLPDAWAIDQLFPIMPIHRLNEAPTREAIIADITCDCDGKIDRFIDLHDVKNTLRLHELRNEEEYYIGVFLVGAYQETLGDLHNLLGDTHVVSIRVDKDGHVRYDREIEGDSVADVLSYVEYDTKSILDRIRQMAERAVRRGRISVQERRKIMDAYESGLRGYTYFER